MKTRFPNFFLIFVLQALQLQTADGAFLGFHNFPFSSNSSLPLLRRQQPLRVSTCGFGDGDANRPRTAGPGFDCRFDTALGIWGFCPTTVISAHDCGLAGACRDRHGCSQGCGILGKTDVTTFTCTGRGADYCSTVRLIAGPDQTFDYLACGVSQVLETLLDAATTTETTKLQNPTPTPTPQPALVSITVTSSPYQPTSRLKLDSETVTEKGPGPIQTTTKATIGTSSTEPQSESVSEEAPKKESGTLTSNSSQTPAVTTKESAAASQHNSIPAIIGGVIGGVALLAIIGFGIWFIRRKQKRGAQVAPQTLGESTWQTGNVQELAGGALYAHESYVNDEAKIQYTGYSEYPAPAELQGAARWKRNTNTGHPYELQS